MTTYEPNKEPRYPIHPNEVTSADGRTVRSVLEEDARRKKEAKKKARYAELRAKTAKNKKRRPW